MLLVELGRLVTPAKRNLRSSFQVIVDIQDKNYIIVQYPLSMKRERKSLHSLKLLNLTISISANDTPFDVQRSIDSNGAVKKFEDSEDYQEFAKENEYKVANDFGRFMIDIKERIMNDVLRERNIIN